MRSPFTQRIFWMGNRSASRELLPVRANRRLRIVRVLIHLWGDMKRRIEPAQKGRVEVSVYLPVRSEAGFDAVAEAIRSHLSRASVGAYVVLLVPSNKAELHAVMTGSFAPGDSLVPSPSMNSKPSSPSIPVIPAGDYALPGGSEISTGESSSPFIIPSEGATIHIEYSEPPDVSEDEEDQEPVDLDEDYGEGGGGGGNYEGPDQGDFPSDKGAEPGDDWASDEWDRDEWFDLDFEYDYPDIEDPSP